MISKTMEQLSFLTGIEPYRTALGKNEASWLKEFREKHWSRFQTLGLPTSKEEEWKYTNLAPLTAKPFSFPVEFKLREMEEFQNYIDPSDINIVLVNGVLSPQVFPLRDLPLGLNIVNLTEAARRHEKEISHFFNRHKLNEEDALIALNHTFANEGAYLRIEKNARLECLIHILHVTSAPEDIAGFPRTLIVMDQSAEASILESHVSFAASRYFMNAVTDIFMEENAQLRYSKAQGESPNAFHLGTTRIWQKRDSQLNSFSFVVGGELTRNNLNVILDGPGSHATVNGLYVVQGTQHVDNHTTIDHRPPNCTSNQLYKGILHDSAHAVFNGKIFVQPEALQTNAYQLNKNLLLGRNCKVDTKPQLEIFADDVKCTHGATIGQLNEDEIFYLQTRSIPKEQAVKILSRGFIDDVLRTIEHNAICEKLNKLLTRTKSV
jgi:Fe-S cluster assembly protein SufD